MWQDGFQVVGIGGVWNWCERGEGYKRPTESKPIPDLNKVNWQRPVTIIFDSDGHNKPLVRLAAFRLARELAKRGATVSILFLSAGPNGEKVGADDFLITLGPEALGDLLKTAWPFNPAWGDVEVEAWWQVRDLSSETPKSLTLKRLAALAPVLAKLGNLEATALLEELRERLKLRVVDLVELKADIKAARKAQEAKGKRKGKALEVKDLEESFWLHPAIDFPGEVMTIGFRETLHDNESGLLLVISDGQGVRAEVDPETVEIGERIYQINRGLAPPLLDGVWGLKRLKTFLDRPTRPKALYGDLMQAFKTFLDLPEPAYGLLAAWTVGTYYAHMCTAFPFLQFYGPKESGKSKTLKPCGVSVLMRGKGET